MPIGSHTPFPHASLLRLRLPVHTLDRRSLRFYAVVMRKEPTRPTLENSSSGGAGGWGTLLIVKPRDKVTWSESKRAGITCLERGVTALRLFIRTWAEGQGHPRNPGVRRL
jgi:hypothetical protein